MKRDNSILTILLVLCCCFLCAAAAGAAEAPSMELKGLWEIGKADNDTREFALGQAGYSEFLTAFAKDPIFIVGRSEEGKDWPYAHPGPSDGWAGGGAHAFTIFFGIETLAGEGDSRLSFDLVDTHGLRPPKLRIEVNEWSSEVALPRGGTDASIFGDPSAGREHRFSLVIPAKALREGLNKVTITTAAGSWMLYDWIGFEVPAATKAGKPTGTLVQSVRLDPWLSAQEGKLCQLMWVDVTRVGDESDVVAHVTGRDPMRLRLEPGRQTVELALPPVTGPTRTTVEIKDKGKTVYRDEIMRSAVARRDPVDWVDPMLGTASSRWMLYPGPSMPFGMVKLSPDNQEHSWKAGYEYLIENIAGFSHIHSWTMGGLLTMPTVGELKTVPGPEGDPDRGYRSRFRHETEFATPGYYAVTLDDYGIRVELTSTTRAGFQRYTFPETKEARILFDLLFPTEYNFVVLDARIRKVSDTEIEGYSKQRGEGGATWNDYTVHFVARFSKPFESFGGWIGEEVHTSVRELSGKGDIGAFVTYSTSKNERIEMQTGISLVSIDQARLNLETEMAAFGWDFDAVRGHARQTWNDLLKLVEVEGGSHEQKVKFYTNFYRSYCARTIWSDVNGKYVDMYEKVQQVEDPESPVYGCDAFWNTFWNLNQLWTLVTPEIANKWVRSLLEIYDRGGWLAKGPTGIEYSSIMVASHEIALIVSAYQKGIRNFDVEKAYEAMKRIQMEPGRPHEGGGHVGNQQLKPYMELGYVPVEAGPVSNTLEYAYDDWCVAQMAKALGKQEDYEYFMKRAGNYRNVFDASVGYMREKHADGSWVEGFSPFSGRGFVEGNSAQYTWFVPQDVEGLIALLGEEEFNRRLNADFEKSRPNNFNATGDRMADFPINHGNQPAMQVAYLFNYSGRPWLTQLWAREIMARYYGTGPIDGYPGDEDQGQMGAWYVMSAIGLFEVDGGAATRPIYEIGSPIFDRVTVHLDPKYYGGKTFVIETIGNSEKNVYVQSATLNGEPLRKPWFHHSELVKGGKLVLLVLRMGPKPNKEWGSRPEEAPPSMTPRGSRKR